MAAKACGRRSWLAQGRVEFFFGRRHGETRGICPRGAWAAENIVALRGGYGEVAGGAQGFSEVGEERRGSEEDG